MNAPVDIWLRGTDSATTAMIEGVKNAPRAWTDDDVRGVLEAMLKTMNRLKHPTGPDHPGRIKDGAHSVLTKYFVDEPGHPTRKALDEILGRFAQRLH